MTTGHGTDDTVEGTDPSTTSTQLKWLCGTEQTGPQKETKAAKLYGETLTLIEDDLYDIGDTVCEVTREAL